MSDCCTPTARANKSPRILSCPVNHHDYVRVPIKTILHHIKDSWRTMLKEQGYYFCNDQDCDLVYFGEDGIIINKSELRTKIFSKEKPDALVCHCFGISMLDAINNPEIKDFVIQQTKAGNCSCETRNPTGRCCLKDFP